MSTRMRLLLLSCIFFSSLSVGWFVFSSTFTTTSIEFDASYVELSRDEMISRADAIFVGQVTMISPARWNQDNGEYWQQAGLAAIPFHEITVAVVQPIVNTIGLEQQVTLTVLGGSSAGSIRSNNIIIANKAEHTLNVGDQAIFFVVKRPLAWRGGTAQQQETRPVIRLIGVPRTSYLVLQRDSTYHSDDPLEPPTTLANLIKKIRTIRVDTYP